MTKTTYEHDEVVYMIDLDGTGSMHPCSKEDYGSVAYIRGDHIDAQDVKIKALVEALIEVRDKPKVDGKRLLDHISEVEAIARAAIAAAKEPT